MIRKDFGRSSRYDNDNAPWGQGERLSMLVNRYAQIVNRNNPWSEIPQDFHTVYGRLVTGDMIFMSEVFKTLQKERAGLLPIKTFKAPPRRHRHFIREMR